MDFQLTETQTALQDTCRQFAEKELTPNARRWDEHHTFPKEAVGKLAELGLMGVAIPEAHGGAGMDAMSYALAMEEISRGCASTGVIMSVNNSLYCDPVYKNGTDALKKKWLEPFARGEKLGCFGLTEPAAGSDAAAQKTTAVRDGDFYRINGSKNFITNGHYADVTVVIAVTDKTQGTHGLSAFVVEKGTKGFRAGKKENKLGLRASDTAELIFEDCEIPEENLLGKAGEGFVDAMRVLDGGRISIAALSLGIGRGALDAALKYVKERRQFGKAIAEFQGIQWKLADMATELDAARLLTQRAAVLKDAGRKVTRESSMAKLFASEVAVSICEQAVQLFGGYGFIKDYPVEKFYRDVKLCTIGEGTSEIQRMVIAREILKVYPSRG